MLQSVQTTHHIKLQIIDLRTSSDQERINRQIQNQKI